MPFNQSYMVSRFYGHIQTEMPTSANRDVANLSTRNSRRSTAAQDFTIHEDRGNVAQPRAYHNPGPSPAMQRETADILFDLMAQFPDIFIRAGEDAQRANDEREELRNPGPANGEDEFDGRRQDVLAEITADVEHAMRIRGDRENGVRDRRSRRFGTPRRVDNNRRFDDNWNAARRGPAAKRVPVVDRLDGGNDARRFTPAETIRQPHVGWGRNRTFDFGGF